MPLILGACFFLEIKFRVRIFGKSIEDVTLCLSRCTASRGPIWSLMEGVRVDPLAKADAWFLHRKAAFFPFVMNNYLVRNTVSLLGSCFSPYFCSLILATTDDSSVKQLLPWDLPKSSWFYTFLLHLLARILIISINLESINFYKS